MTAKSIEARGAQHPLNLNEALVSRVEQFVEDMHIQVEGAEHIEVIMRHTKAGGSVMFTLNHTGLWDPFVGDKDINERKDEIPHLRRLVILSTKFYPDIYNTLFENPGQLLDVSMLKGVFRHLWQSMRLEAGVVHAFGRMHDIEFTPMVQDYRLGEGKFRRHNIAIDAESFRQVNKAIKGGPTWLGISIEGTRSKSGLVKARSGFLRIFRDKAVSEHILILPMALVGFRRGLWDKHVPKIVRYGKPVFYRELEEDARQFHIEGVQDVLMLRVAAMLPAADRGYYNDPKFQDYIQHLESQKKEEKSMVVYQAEAA